MFEDDTGFPTDDQDDDNYDFLDGPAVARITGRLARLDPIGDAFAEVLMWLICEDDCYQDHDGNPREGMHQAIRVRAKTSTLWRLTDNCQVVAACRFHRGQIVLDHFESIEDCDEPLPKARIPERKMATGHGADGHVPSLDEVDKAARQGKWQSLNHSVFHIPVAWHLTTSPKYRKRAFEGKAAEVQAICRGVAEEEGLQVIAIAAEEDHVHVLLTGMTPKTCWSEWIGRWKALTSRRIKAIEGLEGYSWQVGYGLTSVTGGRGGAEEALAIVEQYIRSQGDQSKEDQEVEDAG